MAWIILILASLFEIGFAVGLKYTDGFTKLWPSIFTLTSMTISVVLISIALRDIPLGTGYAVWVGLGTIGAVVFGIVFYAEQTNLARILCLVMVIAGIIGLQLSNSD